MSLFSSPMLFTALLLPGQADLDAALQAAYEQAQAASNATVKEDFAKLADLTHPKVVAMMGGKTKMVAVMETTFKELKAKKFRIVSSRVQPPAKAFQAGGETMTIVPVTLVVSVQDSKISSKSFLVGVSKDGGKHWTFIDGNVGEAKIRDFVPNMPKEMKLPDAEKPVVEKEP